MMNDEMEPQEVRNMVVEVVEEEEQAAVGLEGDADAAYLARRQELIAELDGLAAELREVIPQAGADAYSPLFFLTYLRQSLRQYTPDVQLGVLQSFEGMSRDDLMDVETWKGMAYMFSYSARFQANQVVGRMNEQLPEPLKPDVTVSFVKRNLDRFTPEVAKNIIEMFEGATREDLMNLDTWKGIWYMLNYSLQFQVNQVKTRLLGDESVDDETA
jgi:hypothetical protein